MRRSIKEGGPLSIRDLEQWIDNDERLYRWHLSSRQSKRAFVRENRAELEAYVRGVVNAPPREKTWRDYA